MPLDLVALIVILLAVWGGVSSHDGAKAFVGITAIPVALAVVSLAVPPSNGPAVLFAASTYLVVAYLVERERLRRRYRNWELEEFDREIVSAVRSVVELNNRASVSDGSDTDVEAAQAALDRLRRVSAPTCECRELVDDHVEVLSESLRLSRTDGSQADFDRINAQLLVLGQRLVKLTGRIGPNPSSMA